LVKKEPEEEGKHVDPQPLPVMADELFVQQPQVLHRDVSIYQPEDITDASNSGDNDDLGERSMI